MIKTFKSKVLDNPKLLTPKEDIYVNRQLYSWGEVTFNKLDLNEITELYDLSDNKYFYKVATPFQGTPPNPAIFKRMENDKEVDVTSYIEHLSTFASNLVLFKVAYPNKYFIPSALLLVINREEYNDMTENQKEFFITINSYINLVQRKCEKRPWKNIDGAPTLEEHTMNWVWFRKPGYKLTSAIMNNAQSWIDHNPEMKFVLWTDLENEQELSEFLENIKDVQQQQFTSGRIKVKYLSDVLAFVKDYVAAYKDKDAIKDFDSKSFIDLIETRQYDRTLIAKTDFLRAMILHHFGGFYSDFNDCHCMIPIRYWFQELYKKQAFLLPCDTFNEAHISNFFMYVPKGSKGFRNLHFDTLKGFKGILKCFRDESTPHKVSSLITGYAKKYLKKLKQGETCEPTQLLVDMMFPVYDNSKFTTTIRGALTESGIKGLERSDIRAKMFFPLFVFKYVAQKYDMSSLMEFFEYMVEEFKHIGSIHVQRAPIQLNSNGTMKPSAPQTGPKKFEVQYFNNSHVEDWDDYDDLAKVFDALTEKLDHLENDPEYDKFIYDLFIKNMAAIPMHMTNLIMHLPKELSFHELVPFCFVYVNMTHLTMIGHFGDGSSIGIQDD
jgi:hypothetical protein